MSRLTTAIRNRWLANSSRTHLWRVNEKFAREIAKDMRVLDAGAGSAPYRELFSHAIYESADFEKVDKEYAPPTYSCDLLAIPVEDSRFDFVVLNQVLEHVTQPLLVLKELIRVTKPGGKILCSCPLFYEEHERPYDFYRYTQFGHRYLFETAGWQIESLEWLEGYLGTVGYQLECMYRYLPLRPKHLADGSIGWLALPAAAALKVIAGFMAGVFYRLDGLKRLVSVGYPKNYVVIASKPRSV